MRLCLGWMGLTGKDAIADSGWAHLFREGQGEGRYSRLRSLLPPSLPLSLPKRTFLTPSRTKYKHAYMTYT